MRKKRIIKIAKWFFGTLLSLFLLISLLLYIYKDDICQAAIDEANKHLKAKVTVSEVDLTFWSTFPNLSIDFKNVYVQDPRDGSTSRDTLLHTQLIRCKVNPFDIWREKYKVKSLEIHPGVLNLHVDSAGNNNYDIFKEPEESSGESFDFKLKNVQFTNFRFNYINDATAQEYRTHIKTMSLEGNLSKDVFTAAAKSNLKIIAAKSGNLTLVSNKPAKLGVGVKVNTRDGTVEIPKSTISVANLPFHFEGKVDTLGFNFALSGKNIGIEDAANNLAMEETKDIKAFSGAGTLLFDLKVNGKNEATEPVEITCDFGVEKGMLRDPNSGISLRELSLEGAYSNVGGADKEFVSLKNIGFQTQGGPFRANLKITEFEAPLFQGDAVGLVNLSVIRSLFKLTEFEQFRGTVDVSSRFAVKTHVQEDESKTYDIRKCEGEVAFNKVKAQLVDDKRIYRDIEGRVFLRNDRVGLDNITLNIGSSDFAIDGRFLSVSEYFAKTGNLVADVDIHSNRIILEDLGSDSKEDKLQHGRLFILPDDIEGKAYLDVKKLRYDKHDFLNLRGNMKIKDRLIHFPKLNVSNGGADASGWVKISEDRPEIFYISSHIVSNNISFQKLFKEWDNFEQDVIKSRNITGTAKVSLEFSAPFDLRSGIIMNSIEATAGIRVDNGRLKNVQAFREITQSLNEMASARIAIGKENIKMFEQKLLDLKFDRLENTLIIRNGVIVIPNMSVKSSALDLEISGKHTFSNQIDYRFGFRFRDLKQAETSEFGEIRDDGTGKHVFMRMYGDLYDPSFEWDSEANKAHKKEQRKQAAADARSIFKSEFGLFKNDTTVQEYVKEKFEHEKIEVIINPTEQNDNIIEETKPKKEKKDRKFFNFGEEIEKPGEEKIDLDFD
ncbi:MAG: AsmA-like C-terminal region-containing protein [bacterium]|nr:AsmA-like C-terminal region-containing protein [bacterium]